MCMCGHVSSLVSTNRSFEEEAADTMVELVPLTPAKTVMECPGSKVEPLFKSTTSRVESRQKQRVDDAPVKASTLLQMNTLLRKPA
mmetsp:Transcript_33914/g.63289  ORF Transcript_33914/g.63289 Transcript_33914/m.63289 type:complete len:86 (+) Transcript_33914:95-352(+)